MRLFLHLVVLGLLGLSVSNARAATLTVTNTNDSGSGSLREDIAAAASGDTIVFAAGLSGGTITLTTAELTINKNLTVTGPGANLLKVARSTESGTPAFRIFNITGGTVAISGLTMTGGVVFGGADSLGQGAPSQGGGIRNAGTLTLKNCVVTQNRALGGVGFPISGTGEGGGLFNAGILNLTGCTLNGNQAVGGGGVNNGRGGTAEGGGLCNQGTATLTNCTFSSNVSSGGASNFGSTGDAKGGGVSNRGTATLTNCTLSANSALGGPGSCGGAAFGGGFYQIFASQNSFGQNSVAKVLNTIIAGNSVGSPSLVSGVDVAGAMTSQGHNLIGRTDGSIGWLASDLTGTNSAPLFPQLDSLANNGGPTPTMALQPTSPAVDAGDDSVTGAPLSLTTDQRGAGFPRKMGAHVDIGAYERDASSGSSTLIVTTTDDHDDDVCGVVDCTLREAANAANDMPGANVIQFKTVVAGTITLTGGELLISDAVTVVGPGAPIITVDANLASRVLHIDAPGLVVSISGLTISRGSVTGSASGGSGQGGGIHNNAKLTLTKCVLSGNEVTGGAGRDAGSSSDNGGPGGAGQGAGIYNGGTLTLNSCTVSGNTTTGGNGGTAQYDPNFPNFSSGGAGGAGQGAGIFNGGTLVLSNCTLSGNRIFGGTGGTGPFDGVGGAGQGGGVYSNGTLTLTACTLSGNVAAGGTGFNGAVPGQGGGVFRDGGGYHIVRNSLLAGNTATSAAGTGPDALGAFTSQGFNLIGKSDGSSGFTSVTDQTGTIARPLNPKIGPLANNGGPTQTMALLPGSPAIDKGKDFGLTTDQRGPTRPADASAIPNATGGDGSDIGAFEIQGPFLSINDVGKAEGNSGTSTMSFTITLSPASSQSVAVKCITANISATTADNDYVAVPLTTVTFAPGQTTKIVNVTLNGDTTIEPNETFYMNLSSPSNANIVDNQGVGSILNDDGSKLTINDRSVIEGNSGTKTVSFTVTLSPANNTQTVTVKYGTANGTAVANGDYLAVPSTTLSFAPNETTKVVNITINGDTAVEPDETFFVNLSSATNATIFDNQGIGTITNDDTATAPSALRASTPSTSSVEMTAATASVSMSSVDLSFSDALEAASTADVTHYGVTINGTLVKVQDASYDTKTHTITLALPDGSLKADDEVIVAWHDLYDAEGQTLRGQSGAITAK